VKGGIRLFSLRTNLADQLTLARAAVAPIVTLFVWDVDGHDWWATAAIGGFAAAGAWDNQVAWWALLVALTLTWLSGLDYARLARGLLRGRTASP
jgi:hypothetical protein